MGFKGYRQGGLNPLKGFLPKGFKEVEMPQMDTVKISHRDRSFSERH